MAIFPLRAVLQPALMCAYIASFTIPLAYRELPREIAGVLTGLSMILTSLVHYRCRRPIKQSQQPTRSRVHELLHEPLIESHESRSVYKHEECSWIIMLAIAFEIGNAIFDANFAAILMLIMAVYAILLDEINLSTRSIIGYTFFGMSLAIGLRYVTSNIALRAASAALVSGTLFGSVASYSLPLWDSGQSTKIGFTLSSISVITLFMGASTLELIH